MRYLPKDNVVFFLLLGAVALLGFSCTSTNEWTLVYKNDKVGNTVLGIKLRVIDAIRNGNDIKVGWGSKGANHTIEHLSVPIWLAVLDEQEVIAHLDPQVLADIDWEDLSASYQRSDALRQEWRVVLSTRGEFDAVWYSRAGDSVLKRIPQNHTMSWFVKGDIPATPDPLF